MSFRAAFLNLEQAHKRWEERRHLIVEETHPYWERFDRSIDYIWVRGPLKCVASAVGFNRPHQGDATPWPSDHAGIWADLKWA